MDPFKIVITNESMSIEEGTLNIVDFMNVACAIITQSVQSSCADAPPAARKEIFDTLNLGFSKCLENAFPEYELHPELTEQIMYEVLQRETEEVAERAAEIITIPLPTDDEE